MRQSSARNPTLSRALDVCRLAVAAVLLISVSGQAAARDTCTETPPLCRALDAVYRISSFDPYASAVRIAPNLLVTNRHAVADAATATVYLEGGREIEAKVIPTSYEGDLVLLEAEGLAEGPALEPSVDSVEGTVRVAGYDLSKRDVRLFAPGRFLVTAYPGKVTARLHHTAHTQPGNSGGALLSSDGRLVGIASAGGEGRFDAIPAGEIARLRSLAGPAHGSRHAELGRAYRACSEALEASRRLTKLGEELATRIESACRATANRQMFDLAAQTLGRAREFERSIALSTAALERDPAAANARLSLVVTLMFAGRGGEAGPHLDRLLDEIPAETMVHRLAVMAAGRNGDAVLAKKALTAIAEHNPEGKDAAERFLKAQGIAVTDK